MRTLSIKFNRDRSWAVLSQVQWRVTRIAAVAMRASKLIMTNPPGIDEISCMPAPMAAAQGMVITQANRTWRMTFQDIFDNPPAAPAPIIDPLMV